MIRFCYKPTPEGYLTLHRHAMQRLLPRALKFILGALVAGFLLSPLMDYGQPVKKGIFQSYLSGSGLLIFPAVIAFIFVAAHYGAKRRWSSASELREEVEYEIDESGVRVVASSFNNYIQWQHLARAEMKGGYYFLQAGQNQYYYFPVSAVHDSATLDDLLKRKIRVVRFSS
jgi:hypothetical protein